VASITELPYERVEGHNMCSVGEYLYVFGGMTAFIQENQEISFITPCLKSTLNWTRFAFRKLYQTVEPFTA